MPYKNIRGLPAPIQRLPPHAQKIYMEAFNGGYETTKSDASAAAIAWTAVKKKYKKVGNQWIEK